MNKPITEDYVSYETAKLLKEKRFDESVNRFYEISTGKPSLVRSEYCRNSFTIDYAAPTHQMAIAWILEKYNVYIEATALKHNYWVYIIYKIFDDKVEELYNEGPFKSHEDAVEAALKYTLENLI